MQTSPSSDQSSLSPRSGQTWHLSQADILTVRRKEGKLVVSERYSHKRTAVTNATKQMCRMKDSSQTGCRKESGWRQGIWRRSVKLVTVNGTPRWTPLTWLGGWQNGTTSLWRYQASRKRRPNYSFSYSGAVLWNSLPYDLRQAESLDDSLYKLNSCTPFQ